MQKIKLKIANRVYPLTAQPDQEQGLRTASKKIDIMIKHFEEKYAVKDKQDALAMTALQMANQMIVTKNSSTDVNENDVSDRLRSLESQLDAVLSSVNS